MFKFVNHKISRKAAKPQKKIKIVSKMPYKEKEIKKLYFTIGEVADMFKVNASLIRFWEQRFDIIQPSKNKKGNRLFTQNDIDNFHVIYHLVKERGFTLEGANEHLKNNKHGTEKNVEILKSLNKIKDFLIEIKEGMD
jgi:DNA-binding transcriptional MerR regulator